LFGLSIEPILLLAELLHLFPITPMAGPEVPLAEEKQDNKQNEDPKQSKHDRHDHRIVLG
jgi:hypothetical protein